MKKIDIVSIAFGNFRRRKMRSILTVLGVVIGVASIVSMLSLGIAVKTFFQKSIEGMGDLTTVTIMPGYDQETGKQTVMGEDVVKQFEELANVTAVSPEMRLNGKIISGKYMSYANIVGITPAYMEKLGFKAEKGTIEGLSESTGKIINCVFGAEAAYQFYNPKSNNGGGMGGMMYDPSSKEERPPPEVDVMGEDTRLRFTFDWSYGEKQPGGVVTQPAKKAKLYAMKNLGVLKGDMSEKDFTVYVDIETAKKLKKEQLKYEQSLNAGAVMTKKATPFSYDQIKVLTDNIEYTTQVCKQIKDMGYEAWSMSEYIQTSQQQMKMIQLILGGIGSVSLLVAAIGITNTMIMSIYERTREIGIMKVIGCQLKDIGTMFLCEAGFIGLFGGAVGLLLSYGVSFALNSFAKGGSAGGPGAGMGLDGMTTLSIIPFWLALGAVAFAILVGIISGFFPARRAMHLSALEAMRN